MILAIVFVSFMIQNAGADDAAPLVCSYLFTDAIAAFTTSSSAMYGRVMW